jgi:phosphatidylglycerophosphatase A
VSERLSVLLATGGYLSYIPVRVLGLRKWSGAGLLGTFEALALVPLLPESPRVFLGWLLASTLAACWLCGRAERTLGPDDPRIILDEIVGYWTAIAFLPRTPGILAAAFLLFRLFDSVKLPPYKWLERLPGGYGVVGDDIGAGIVANLLVRAFA